VLAEHTGEHRARQLEAYLQRADTKGSALRVSADIGESVA
jgi:hypothetical protein